ncbi:MAG: hypothetical protein ABEJ23_08765 [Haloarculaceae archaeon]
MALDAPSLPAFGVPEGEAVVGAGLFGAFQGGLLLQLWNTDAIRQVGATAGWPTLDGGWIVLLCYGVLLAVPFVAFVSGSIDAFATRIIVLSRNSAVLQRLLVPLLKVSALGTTLFALGQVYGLLVAVTVWGVALPAWLTLVVGRAVPFPYVNPFTLFAWATYGGMTGLAYGLILEH